MPKPSLLAADDIVEEIEENEPIPGLKNRRRFQRPKKRERRRSSVVSSWIDEDRSNLVAYEYLCHIGEAKEWIESCLEIQLPSVSELDEELRNGVILAKLARHFEPEVVPKIFEHPKLQFRHSDNINYFFDFIKLVGLPENFQFELTDLYNKKNFPKVIFCIHALSHLMAYRKRAPNIKNLIGILEFSELQIAQTEEELKLNKIAMPQFNTVRRKLAKDIREMRDVVSDFSEWTESSDFETSREDELERHFLRRENYNCLVSFQAAVRGKLARQKFEILKVEQQQHLEEEKQARRSAMQAAALKEAQERKKIFQAATKAATKIQAHIRGHLARKEYRENELHYKQNMEKIIRLQSIVRGRKASRAYKNLTIGENPPINAMKNFVYLLEDSEIDFTEELELEKRKQQAVKKIRENQSVESELNEIDMKIALLVRNRISLEEVLKASRRHARIAEDNELAHSMLTGFDKESRGRLKCYQRLFYLIQTRPEYLGKLVFAMSQSAIGDREKKYVENVVLTVFGFAQNAREEYLLLKLFQRAIKEEMEYVVSSSDIVRSNPVFIRLAIHYQRGAKERQYLRDLLTPLIKQVVEDPSIDLETDPLLIYRGLIRDEETRTGMPSTRPYHITREEALADAETRNALIQHLQQLRTLTDQFLLAIQSSLADMPYGIRFIAREMRIALMDKFPEEQENSIMKIVGHVIYYRYINPAIVAPETFDVMESLISPIQRKNLAEIAKMLNQISVGKQFTDDNIFLQPLNNYVSFTSEKFARFAYSISDIPTAEEFFQIDEFFDLTNTNKPIVYISMQEMFAMHALLESNIEHLAPDDHDPLRILLHELGHAPEVSVEDRQKQGNEIALELSGPIDIRVEDSQFKKLFVETKRLVIYILRIQTGPTLVDLLERPVTQWEEQQYVEMRLKELGETDMEPVQRFKTVRKSMMNIHDLSFAQLKQTAYQNLSILERNGWVSRQNDYQEMINSIAMDIRNKHKRRNQRKNELGKIKITIQNLEEKSAYLKEQRNAYLDYINSCLSQLSTKSRRKSVLPFSRQYFHLRELQRTSRVPKFGSYKYSAERLHEKGILISIEGYGVRQYDRISLTISSDELGVFKITAFFMGIKLPGGEMELKLEELLQAQFNNVPTMTLLDGIVKVNVNLLVFFVNKKFFA